jgi:serine/threonine protein kinase
VRPIAAGADAELAWLAEAYIDGTPLAELIGRDGPWPIADVLLRITQIAGALDFAAAVGVFHGALHPAEILVTEDRTLLSGLGLVQALSKAGLDVPMSGAGVSPQRALGLPVTHPDDIFALAAMTFQVLYRRSLDDPSKLKGLVTPLAGVNHVRLCEVLARALSEDPGDRPGSALEFAGALQQGLAAEPEPEIPISLQSSVPESHADSDSAIPVASPISTPVAAPIDDLPLRPEPPSHVDFESRMVESKSEAKPAGQNSIAEFELRSQTRELESEYRRRVSWAAVAAALMIGILTGFGAGFVVGQRDLTPSPRRAERPVPRAQRESVPETIPAPTAGQDFTESTVPPTPVDEPEVKSPQSMDPSVDDRSDRLDRAGQSEQPDRPEQSVQLEPAVPASIEVVSRPSGAQVFVNGRLVGRTPLVVSDMRPGAHAVRIALPGHQRWVTTVDVAAGSRARVAASLER